MPPELTDLQREAARERALVARKQRAALKSELRSGELSFEDVLDLSRGQSEASAAASRLRVGEVLLAIPGVGEAKADALLVGAGVNGNRRVRGLGSRQVDRLLTGLRK